MAGGDRWKTDGLNSLSFQQLGRATCLKRSLQQVACEPRKSLKVPEPHRGSRPRKKL